MIMNFRNLIFLNIIAFLGILVFVACFIEFLPTKIYPHLSLINFGYVLTYIYLLIIFSFIILIIEVILNICLSLKYTQSAIFKYSLVHNIFLILGLLFSFLFFIANSYMIKIFT